MVDRRFRIVQLRSEGYEHLRAFDEVARSLTDGVAGLGYDASLSHRELLPGATNLLLGAHLLSVERIARLPPSTIVYNHEQIDETSLLPVDRLTDFAGVRVWDYSAKNVAEWAAQGIDAAHVPIGWSAGLETVARDVPRDIDVLFYGSINERRQRVLRALRRRGMAVHAAFGVYGEERDALIARAEVVLNVQYYERGILEMVRLSHLFANGVPVVSETAPGMEVPPGFDDAAAFATYDRLVDTTRAVLDDPAARAELGRRGQERMRAQPWSRSLDGVLDGPGRPAPRSSAPAVPIPAGPDGPPPRRVVELVCGPPGPSLAGQAASADGSSALTPLVDELLALGGTSRLGLGPPPTPDAAAVDVLRRQWGDRLAALVGPVPVGSVGNEPTGSAVVLVDPAFGLVLPYVLGLVGAHVKDVRVTLVLDPPDVVVDHLQRTRACPPGVGALVWLSHAIFADAYSRELPRDVVGGDHDEPAVEPPTRFAASVLADRVRSALLAPAPRLDEVDRAAARYLDAMELYLPLVLDRDP